MNGQINIYIYTYEWVNKIIKHKPGANSAMAARRS
jgi:hypothetical protein